MSKQQVNATCFVEGWPLACGLRHGGGVAVNWIDARRSKTRVGGFWVWVSPWSHSSSADDSMAT